MPKELTREQKLKKYNAPKTKIFTVTLLRHYDRLTPESLIEKLQSVINEYKNEDSELSVDFESENDYYDTYHNLVLEIKRPLTIEEEDAIIAKGDKEAEKKDKSFKKKQDEYIKALRVRYPHYELPKLPE